MTNKPKQILFKPFMASQTHKKKKFLTSRLGGLEVVNENPDEWSINYATRTNRNYMMQHSSRTQNLLIVPKHKTGDNLWVRETWRVSGWWEGEPLQIQFKDGHKIEDYSNGDENGYEDWYERMTIQSSEDMDKAGFKSDDEHYLVPAGKELPTRWRPNIHMPRWVCRSILEVIDLRLCRIKDMTIQGFIYEGMELTQTDDLISWFNGKDTVTMQYDRAENAYDKQIKIWNTGKACFALLWDGINGIGAYEVNPWVFGYEYKLLDFDKVVYSE